MVRTIADILNGWLRTFPSSFLLNTLFSGNLCCETGLCNYSLGAKPLPRPVLVNKVLLAICQACSFRCCPWLLRVFHGRVHSLQQRPWGPQSWKYFLSDPLQKMLPTFCRKRCWNILFLWGLGCIISFLSFSMLKGGKPIDYYMLCRGHEILSYNFQYFNEYQSVY